MKLVAIALIDNHLLKANTELNNLPEEQTHQINQYV